MTYDYPTAFSSWNDDEHHAIARVVNSGRYTMGAETEAFEHEFAAYHKRKHCVMVNSGSSANLIATAALFHLEHAPLKRGDKAIVPAIAWATTYAPLVQMGLDLVVEDVDETWNAKPKRETDFRGVRLIVDCSVLGNPGYLCDSPDARVLNDDCESLGARIGDRTTGSFGLMATSSFFYSHQLSAIEGGAVLTDDDECARLLRLLRNHGNAGFLKKDAPFDQSYSFELFGFNVRPPEMHAAIGRVQLQKLDGFIATRCANRNVFRAATFGLPVEHPRWTSDTSSPFGLHFTVESSDVRAKLVDALRAASIDCRLPTGGSFRRHAYGRPWADQLTPNADRIHDRGLFLGNAPWDISDKIELAVKVMRGVL